MHPMDTLLSHEAFSEIIWFQKMPLFVSKTMTHLFNWFIQDTDSFMNEKISLAEVTNFIYFISISLKY